MADSQTEQLLEKWSRATRDLKEAKDEVNSAEVRLMNATIQLGKWLTPDDALPGEKFAIWYNGQMLEIKVIDKSGNGTYDITWRKGRREVAKGKSNE